jgi:lysine-N-methylase
MLYIKPAFYDKFKCIADKCTDSCCIGWEINIDDETMDVYKNMHTEFGSKIRANIVKDEDDTYSFKLLKGERCPFLNKSNLCDIITNCGEDNICYICKEHPRFYNDFQEVTEYGLGLCCEEVVRLLLENDEPLEFVAFNDEDEFFEVDEREKESYDKLFDIRNEIFEILRTTEIYNDKIEKIINVTEKFCGEKIKLLNDNEILEMYEKTEPINNEWIKYFKELKKNKDEIREKEKPFDEVSNGDSKYSKLLSYIIFRHLLKTVFSDVEDFSQYLSFCVSSVRFIKLCDIKTYVEKGLVSKTDRINNIKRWSKQIEYSEENINLLIFEN